MRGTPDLKQLNSKMHLANKTHGIHPKHTNHKNGEHLEAARHLPLRCRFRRALLPKPLVVYRCSSSKSTILHRQTCNMQRRASCNARMS